MNRTKKKEVTKKMKGNIRNKVKNKNKGVIKENENRERNKSQLRE
jgi:hypothetical protein